MFLKIKSEFCLKNDIEGDRYVDSVIVLTKHAEDRKLERRFDDRHIFKCLKQGVTKLGKQTKKHKCRPFKNTATVLKDGKFIQATTVYALNNDRHGKVRVITVYYHDE